MGNDTQEFDLAERLRRFERFAIFFSWLKMFYPKVSGLHFAYLAKRFFPQKILRINGGVPWPVHFTSTIVSYRNIKIGSFCTPGYSPGCYIQAKNGIVFGNHVFIAPNVGIVSANHDPKNTARWIKTKPMVIGNNVWIGMNSVILPAVTIGDNVSVGAGSVVTKDIPSNCIAAGNPCRVIRHTDLPVG